MSGDMAGVVLVGTPMPPAATARPFVGREEERAWLAAALSGGSRRLVQVVAPGGMGKTGLVAAWLREAMAAGPAGGFTFQRVFRWDFHGEASVPALPWATWRETLAAALGAQLRVGDSPAEVAGTLGSALVGRRTLLVLDGLEVALFSPGDPRAGEFRDHALPALLGTLFSGDSAGGNGPCCVVTTRQAVREWPSGVKAATLELPRLTDGVSLALLQKLGMEASGEETVATVRFAGGRPLWLRRLAGRGGAG